VARKTSERTRKIRQVVERIPPETINEISLSDLEPQLHKAGISVESDKEKYTVYSELTRRRRQLGKLGPSVRRRKVLRLPAVPVDHEVGVLGHDERKPRAASSPEYFQDLGKLAAAYGRIKDQIRAEDWNIDVPSVMLWVGKLDSDDIRAIRHFSEKYGLATLTASAVAFLLKDKETTAS